MSKINPKYVEKIIDQVNGSPYFRLMSMHLRGFEIGASLVEIDVQEKHLQTFRHGPWWCIYHDY